MPFCKRLFLLRLNSQLPQLFLKALPMQANGAGRARDVAAVLPELGLDVRDLELPPSFPVVVFRYELGRAGRIRRSRMPRSNK